MLGWKWAAKQNQHKVQKVGSYPLARFNVWQIPEQPFPSVTLGALQELVRQVGSYQVELALCRHEGLIADTRAVWGACLCHHPTALPPPCSNPCNPPCNGFGVALVWVSGCWQETRTARNAGDAERRARSRLNLALCLYLHARHLGRKGRSCQCWEWSPWSSRAEGQTED